MRERLVPFALLVGASVLHLPIVYEVVQREQASAPLAMAVGLLSMGLAWSAGCSLEDRRRGTVRGIAACGVLFPLLAFVPGFPLAFEAWEGGLLLASSALSGIALAVLLRVGPTRSGSDRR